MTVKTQTHVFVVMAKCPSPGAVKTRLTQTGQIDESDAATLATAMLHAIVQRLLAAGTAWLAVTPDGAGDQLLTALGLPVGALPIIGQGPGTLGERIERIWQTIHRATGGCVTFFGMDSPDLPGKHLDQVLAAGGRGDVDAWIGSTEDGGYWAIGGHQPQPALLRGIDWGTAVVYDQTCQRARQEGIRMLELPAWHDIDEIADLHAMQARLSEQSCQDPSLQHLREQVNSILAAAPNPSESSP